MDGQISITDYQNSISYDRRGRTRETPKWVDAERCNNCVYWDLDPVDDQPPDGWGVIGMCCTIHDPKQVGYQNTSKTSYCGLFEWR